MMIMKKNFFLTYTSTREKKKRYCNSFSFIIAYCGDVKQQDRAANGPFGLQVNQPPRGDENMS